MVTLEPVTGHYAASAGHASGAGPDAGRLPEGSPDRLLELSGPSLLVLEIDDGRHRATSIVGDLPVTAFEDGTVRPHEQVDDRRVAALRRHVAEAGSVATPVCVAHRGQAQLDGVVAEVTAAVPDLRRTDAAGTVTLWVVDDADACARLQAAVAATDGWLIADGHHRAAAARDVGRVLVALTPDAQLTTRPFHRRLAVTDPARVGEVLHTTGLAVTGLAAAATPRRAGEVTVAADRRWWRVLLEPTGAGPGADLDVVRAERQVLAPLAAALGAGTAPEPTPPADDPAELLAGDAVLVLLHPPTLAEVRRVVATRAVLPAKSTYVVPKHRPDVLVVPRPVGLS